MYLPNHLVVYGRIMLLMMGLAHMERRWRHLCAPHSEHSLAKGWGDLMDQMVCFL